MLTKTTADGDGDNLSGRATRDDSRGETGERIGPAKSAKPLTIFLDGKFVPEADAKISVFDHGLLYGDGIFEGIRFYNGRVFRLEEHLDRLWDSARSICLEIPMSRSEMTEALLETIRKNDLRDGYIRLIVTRGVGNLGLNPTQCKRPSVIIIATTIALYPEEMYENGLTVVTCATRRTGPGALNPAVKSLNYLNNVMARIEANLAGADEALMLNDAGLHRGMHRGQYFRDQTRRNFYATDYGGSVAGNHALGRVRYRGGTRNQNFRDRYHPA